jgi:hypothetical protein
MSGIEAWPPRRSEAATGAAAERQQKNFTARHAHFGTGFRNEDEIASSNFEEQVEEICLADSGGPGLGSVRQSLFMLIDRA